VLLQLADKSGNRDGDGLRIRHDLTVEKLAGLVRASRETVSKALDDFAHYGWIRVQGSSVTLLDERALRRRAR
jgi:CRP-like cAMP-binding protein